MTEAQGTEQLRLAEEIGLMVKDLYDNLARIRDVKRQAADLATKTPALAGPAKALKVRSRPLRRT